MKGIEGDLKKGKFQAAAKKLNIKDRQAHMLWRNTQKLELMLKGYLHDTEGLRMAIASKNKDAALFKLRKINIWLKEPQRTCTGILNGIRMQRK